jgi:hypothetical protein
MTCVRTTSRSRQWMVLTVLFVATLPFDRSAPAAPPAEPGRDVVFKVQKLGCTLVEGVGCGHLLAPTLDRVDRIEGVSRSLTNWTGTMVRVVPAPGADPQAVARRVRAALDEGEYAPELLGGAAKAEALKKEHWRGLDRVHELTSFEFRTVARRLVESFAQAERLEKEKTSQLLKAVDEVWESSARGKKTPPADEEGYGAYWRDRLATFKAALLARVRDQLSAEQVDRLSRLAEREAGNNEPAP